MVLVEILLPMMLVVAHFEPMPPSLPSLIRFEQVTYYIYLLYSHLLVVPYAITDVALDQYLRVPLILVA